MNRPDVSAFMHQDGEEISLELTHNLILEIQVENEDGKPESQWCAAQSGA